MDETYGPHFAPESMVEVSCNDSFVYKEYLQALAKRRENSVLARCSYIDIFSDIE